MTSKYALTASSSEAQRRTFFERLFRLDCQVQPAEVEAFLQLGSEPQFVKLRELRREAAHLGGGSLGALAAIFMAAALIAYPLIITAVLQMTGVDGSSLSLSLGIGVTALGATIALSYALSQNNSARAAVRLAFYEEALARQHAEKAPAVWAIGRWRISRS